MHETLGSFVDIVLIVRQRAKVRSKNRQQIGLYRGHSPLGVAAVVAFVGAEAVEAAEVVATVEAVETVEAALIAEAALIVEAALTAEAAVAPQKNQKLRLAHHYILKYHNRPTQQGHQDERE